MQLQIAGIAPSVTDGRDGMVIPVGVEHADSHFVTSLVRGGVVAKVDRVVTVATTKQEHIATRTTIQRVVATTSIQRVIHGTPAQVVIIDTPAQRIIATHTIRRVRSSLTVDSL